MRDKIQYGTSLIDYSLEYSDRKTLGIKVHPDKSVQVIAPVDASVEDVRVKVKSKARWILRQQDFFLSFHPLTPERRYVSGETHLYLGKQYKLKVHQSSIEQVKLQGGMLKVFTKDKLAKDRIKRQIQAWYKEKAVHHFKTLFKSRLLMSKAFYEEEPILYYRWMKKRWGSCDKNGGIHLNLELIKAPKKCIDYVIVHELCHLAHLDHSRAFYSLLERNYPKWRETKDELERLMV
ncbi:MAG: M48 family metallopeptidase [Saprospiraceae bacterium]